jgi:2-polyprenyl-3-methyl-5-hydroxy-6-metoxy-1,4-benzoquinol methylase
MEALLRYALLAGFAFYVLNQVRKPTRWVGRLFLWIMNSSHSGVTDWGLKHVRIEKDFKILDVGCGGRTIEKLAAVAPEGVVHGMDYANGSVAASRAKNTKLIKEGRVAIQQASVSQLPFAENTCNLVTAVETQY